MGVPDTSPWVRTRRQDQASGLRWDMRVEQWRIAVDMNPAQMSTIFAGEALSAVEQAEVVGEHDIAGLPLMGVVGTRVMQCGAKAIE